MRGSRSFWCLVVLLAAACSSQPPPRWAEGGAPLAIGPARWDRPDDDTVELAQDGTVREDGSLLFTVDRAGRVFDEDNSPVAILLPDGHVVGPDNQYLGQVGVANAAPPHSDSAWIAVLPNGQVMRFDDEGERSTDGTWTGCQGPRHRVCTLVTHLVTMRNYHPTSSGVMVGVGVGVPL